MGNSGSVVEVVVVPMLLMSSVLICVIVSTFFSAVFRVLDDIFLNSLTNTTKNGILGETIERVSSIPANHFYCNLCNNENRFRMSKKSHTKSLIWGKSQRP